MAPTVVGLKGEGPATWRWVFSFAGCRTARAWACPTPDRCQESVPRCHELQVRDEVHNWRIFCRIDADAVLVLDVHEKKTPRTPKRILDGCRIRAERYDRDAKGRTR